MKNVIILFFLPALCGQSLISLSQVEMDKAITLTGTGVDARITGIESVVEAEDATSVGSIQSNRFLYAPATGSGGNYAADLSPEPGALLPGVILYFKANHDTPGAATLDVNNLGSVPILKHVNQPLNAGDIISGQMVAVIFDGVNFQLLSGTAESGSSGGVPQGGCIYTVNATPPQGYSYSGYSFNPNTAWTTQASIPTARQIAAAASYNGKLYVFGGLNSGTLNTTQEYDPATNSWTSKASMPVGTYGHAAVTLNNKIHVVGGWVGSNPSSIHQVYDPVTNTWSTAANTISPRFGHGLAAAGGKIYTVTNWPGNGSVEEYDPATNSWTTRANYPVATYGIAVGSINGKVYASGGNGSAEAYVFDPATNSWTALPNSPVGGPGCNGAVYNNRFYMFRAQSGGGNASAYFDPLSNAWQTVLSPSDVDFEGDYANACGEAGGKIYLIGGRIPNTSSYVSTNREFDPNQPAELFLHCQD